MRCDTLLGASLGLLVAAAALSGCGEDEALFPPKPPVDPPVEEQIEPAEGGIRRLLGRQYVNSVRLLFGETAAEAADPPEDYALHGFDTIGAAQLALPGSAVEQYETSARAIAQAVVSDTAVYSSLPCVPSGINDSTCFKTIIAEVGRVAWQRPLETSEIDSINAVAITAAEEYQIAQQGVFYAITALLQAPDFIYVVELGEEDPENPGRFWLTQPELVTRMSLFLTDTIPSADMLDAAEAGEYGTAEAVRALAEELVAQPAAKPALEAYYTQLLGLRRLGNTAKDEELFPNWNAEVVASMQGATLAFVNDIVWTRDADAREMLTANYAYVNDDLAPLYSLPPTGSDELQKVTTPASQQRRGLISQPSFLAAFGSYSESSPTKRGAFIQRNIMCNVVPPPPAGVTPELPEIDPENPITMKERLEGHQKDENCASCHKLTDPMGFPLELYDSIGTYRTEDENGLAIDPSGELDALGAFADVTELASALAEHQQIPDCMVRNIYRNSMGHLESKGEEPAIAAIGKAFEENGFSMQTLLVEVVASPAFQMVGDPK